MLGPSCVGQPTTARPEVPQHSAARRTMPTGLVRVQCSHRQRRLASNPPAIQGVGPLGRSPWLQEPPLAHPTLPAPPGHLPPSSLLVSPPPDFSSPRSSAVAAAFLSYPTTSPTRSSPSLPPPPPPTWDLELWGGVTSGDPWAAFCRYCRSKLSNASGSAAHATASDLLWTFAGMFSAVAALGLLSLHAKEWPIVGAWHQQGLGLLLGSFGTLCVLIFGRPGCEPVRLWNILFGHAVATSTVLVLLKVLGACVMSRALAMAVMIMVMQWTDSVHPPGGALVLMAVDSATIQSMSWWFMLYPSLTFTLLVLLPLGAATNWLKRNVRFDLPAAMAAANRTTSQLAGGAAAGAVLPPP